MMDFFTNEEMLLKQYIFTNEEMLLVRDALIEECHRKMEACKPNIMTEYSHRRMRVLRALADQFKDDCGRMK